MKKKKKKKEKKTLPISNPKFNSVTGEWLYLSHDPIDVVKIRDALFSGEGKETFPVEVWKDMGVMEVILAEKSSMDFEELMLDLGEEGDEFLKSYNTKSLFCVTFRPESYENAKRVMEKIVAAIGGMFCADQKGWMPRIE